MNERLTEAKTWIVAFFTALGAAVGWKGVLAAVWVLVMALDYISGSAAACRAGEWSSSAARQGLWHKGGMILVVAVAAIADCMILTVGAKLPTGLNFAWPGVLFPMVLAWYIITELGSILENAVKLGANVPDWLAKALKISLNAVDKAGSTAAGSADEEDAE